MIYVPTTLTDDPQFLQEEIHRFAEFSPKPERFQLDIIDGEFVITSYSIHYTKLYDFTQVVGGGTSSWNTTVAIPSAVSTAISDEGLEDLANFDKPEIGSLLYTPGIILQNGNIDLLLTPWEADDSSGGYIYGVNE